MRDYEGSVFESKEVGDEYTDIEVLPLIIYVTIVVEVSKRFIYLCVIWEFQYQ